ncbi:MAG: hypothetical protein GXO17_02750 [Thermodesulfobacteria bacterium]|nr:hypothetical protein [Thermodesulfobacteriota bacterium]
MIYRTFLHLPGIDQKGERRLWAAGIEDWWDFLAAESVPGFSTARLRRQKEALRFFLSFADDLVSLAAYLKRRHHWRFFEPFGKNALFLDIETDGLKKDQSRVTVLGLSDGVRYRAFVAGEDLEEGLEILAAHPFWVTFGGSFFDWPFLRHHYPWLPEPVVHLDLCPLLRRLGLRGGLKRIEKMVGLSRPEEVEGLDGFEAVRLWWRYRRGDERALRRLILYNRQDVENLPLLARLAYEGLRSLALTGKIPALTVSSEPRKTRREEDGRFVQF